MIKKENSFIFIDLNMMTTSEYEKVIDEIKQYEGERYYFLPNKYFFTIRTLSKNILMKRIKR